MGYQRASKKRTVNCYIKRKQEVGKKSKVTKSLKMIYVVTYRRMYVLTCTNTLNLIAIRYTVFGVLKSGNVC